MLTDSMLPKKFREFEKECLARNLPIVNRKRAEWLYNKVKEVKPRSILEIGTLNGYSGCILGSQGAKLTTIELETDKAEEARVTIVGDGVEVVKNLVKRKEKFDLVFLDFAQRRYIEILEECIKLVRKGGIVIADNILLPKCKEYLDAVKNHPKLKTEIIEISQGLSCSQMIR